MHVLLQPAKAWLFGALLLFVRTATAGSPHPEAGPFLCASRPIPLRKKDGRLRPIAVGGTLRRRVAMWLLTSAPVQSAARALSPLQPVIAKGGPCELVAMGVEAVAEPDQDRSTGWLLLQVDLKNAFNSIYHSAILSAFEKRCPTPLPWVSARTLACRQPANLVDMVAILATREPADIIGDYAVSCRKS